MNSAPLSPDDPKLTAYALGELDFEESARIAEAIKGDVAAQAVIEEIRALAEQLECALENEPILPESAPFSRELSRLSASAPVKVQTTFESAEEKMRFPALWILGLAAACIMVVIASLPPPAASGTADHSHETAAQALPGARPDGVAPNALPAAAPDRPVLPMVDNRKRALSPGTSDVNPAPLRDDGLEKWRSVTDIGGAPSSPAVAKNSPQPAPAVEPKAYQLVDYKNPSTRGAQPGAEADHAVTAQFEVVPVSILEAAKMDAPPVSSDISDTPLLAADNPGRRELLTLKISYRHSAVDLAQHLELPRIEPVVDLALANKDFKLAVDAAGLGKKLKAAPHKISKPYDDILSWPEEKPDSLVDSTKPGNESLDTTKRTVE